MPLNSATLHSLRFFEAAARLESFKHAALELHVTQGAVSQQIKQLEERLGCRLFDRLPRQLQLTDEGRRFAAVVRRALAEINAAAESLAGEKLKGAIHVRVAPSLAIKWLVPRLGDFYRRYPDIQLHIVAEFGRPDAAHRRYALMIERCFSNQRSSHSRKLLMPEYLVPVCSPAWLARHDFLQSPADLANCTLLHDAAPWDDAEEDAEWRYWLQAVGAEQVDSVQGQFFSQADLAMEAAIAGQGIALGRAALLGDLLETGQLCTPFEQRIRSPADYHIVANGNSFEIPRVKLFVDWLKEAAADACINPTVINPTIINPTVINPTMPLTE